MAETLLVCLVFVIYSAACDAVDYVVRGKR